MNEIKSDCLFAPFSVLAKTCEHVTIMCDLKHLSAMVVKAYDDCFLADALMKVNVTKALLMGQDIRKDLYEQVHT